jgi:hypothetical protein
MDDLKRLFDMRENALAGLRETKTAIREETKTDFREEMITKIMAEIRERSLDYEPEDDVRIEEMENKILMERIERLDRGEVNKLLFRMLAHPCCSIYSVDPVLIKTGLVHSTEDLTSVSHRNIAERTYLLTLTTEVLQAKLQDLLGEGEADGEGDEE